jgi:hypothetical protein
MKHTLIAAFAALSFAGPALAANTASYTFTSANVAAIPGALDSFDFVTIGPRALDETIGTFTDQFRFTLLAASPVCFNFRSVASDTPDGTSELFFDSISLNRSDATGVPSISNVSGGLHLASYSNTLEEGSYILRLNGHVSGDLGGSYIGNGTTAPTVPEPGSLAMLLGGLGIAGVLVRGRKLR